jgi:hypothetical protein
LICRCSLFAADRPHAKAASSCRRSLCTKAEAGKPSLFHARGDNGLVTGRELLKHFFLRVRRDMKMKDLPLRSGGGRPGGGATGYPPPGGFFVSADFKGDSRE